MTITMTTNPNTTMARTTTTKTKITKINMAKTTTTKEPKITPTKTTTTQINVFLYIHSIFSFPPIVPDVPSKYTAAPKGCSAPEFQSLG